MKYPKFILQIYSIFFLIDFLHLKYIKQNEMHIQYFSPQKVFVNDRRLNVRNIDTKKLVFYCNMACFIELI